MDKVNGALEQGKHAPTPRVLALAIPDAEPLALNSAEFDDIWCALRRAAEKSAEDASYHASQGHGPTASMLRERTKRFVALSEKLYAARFGR